MHSNNDYTPLQELFKHSRPRATALRTAPETLARNGVAEHTSAIVTDRMRALASALSWNLWPFFHNHAFYLVNRTPTRALDWKTSFKVLNERLSRPRTKHYPFCNRFVRVHPHSRPSTARQSRSTGGEEIHHRLRRPQHFCPVAINKGPQGQDHEAS